MHVFITLGSWQAEMGAYMNRASSDRNPGKRRQKRVKMVVPVRLWDGQSCEIVHTLDVTPGGTRLGGLRHSPTPGTVVEVQRHNKRARFRVVWAASPSAKSKEIQVGLQCMEPEKHIWAVDLPEEADDF
jgi:hypothetical protein